MKTEIDRICGIMYTLLEHQPVIDVPYEKINDIAVALVKEGYGDVSEYKNEIERVKSENEKLKIKCDNLKRLSDWQREEIKMLKAEVNKGCDNCETIKQGQVDVLKELKTRHDYAIKNMGYPWDISQQIDELIKEIENADKD